MNPKTLGFFVIVRPSAHAMFGVVDGNRHSSNFLAGMERIRLELLSIFVVFTDSSFFSKTITNIEHYVLGAAVKIGRRPRIVAFVHDRLPVGIPKKHRA